MKAVRLGILLVMAATATFGGAQQDTTADFTKDPAYKELMRLAGGTWKTGLGNMAVESHWQLAGDKTSLVCETVVGKGSPKPFVMNARLGWDPTAKQVYYLDAHMHDTVYFGHASLEGKEVVLRFGTLVGQVAKGEPSNYAFHCQFVNDDEYNASLYLVEGGKETKKLESFVWKRTKD